MPGQTNQNNPFQSQVRVGPSYITLVPGPPGPAGTSAVVVTTTANYTQPAVSGTVTVNVTSTTPFAAGLGVYVQGGGYYTVQSITNGTQMVLTNLGSLGNASPTSTVTSPALVVPTGPPSSTLTVEAGTGAITQRAILNLIGLYYSDDPGNGSMDFSLLPPAPSTTINGNVTLAATDTIKTFADGPYTINVQNWIAGREYMLIARGAGGLNGTGQVTLSAGSSSFSIEDPQPTGSGFSLNTVGTSPNRVTMRTDFMTYRWWLDSQYNILRCIS
jgi:hypothetical protein